MRKLAFCSLSLPLPHPFAHAVRRPQVTTSYARQHRRKSGTFRLQTDDGDCHGHRDCGNNMSDLPSSRFTGITVADFANDGAHLTATLAAEAGTFTCTGTIQNGELSGTTALHHQPRLRCAHGRSWVSPATTTRSSSPTPSSMSNTTGYSRCSSSAFSGMDSDNLIALAHLPRRPGLRRGLTALGYAVPDADKLVALSVQGVNADEVRQIRTLGYQPTLDQLIQIRIFKVTPDFIQRMQARGLKNLTIDKLVQIRIFKLAD